MKKHPQANLREQLKNDLKLAMKARERAVVAALRGMLSALDNAEAVAVDAPAWPPVVNRSADVPRRALSDDQVRAVLQAEADEHQRAMVEYERLGQEARADELRTKLAVVERYLAEWDDEH